MSSDEPLWRPTSERIEQAGITRFMNWLRDERGLAFDGYEALWRWSVEQLEAFWAAFHDWAGVIAHTPCRQNARCPARAGSKARP